MIAAIVGSCSALIVSVVGVWNSRRQLHIQLEQQSREFKLAREMTLRRDVYLDAAVAIARATNSLNELADVTVVSKELARQYAADFAALAKVHVVGAAETIEALTSVTLVLGDAQADLNAARIPILDMQTDVASAAPDNDSRMERRRAYTEARLELAERALIWAARVATHVPTAIAAIRRELDLPQREHYQQSFERAWDHTQAHLRTRIQAIRKELHENGQTDD